MSGATCLAANPGAAAADPAIAGGVGSKELSRVRLLALALVNVPAVVAAVTGVLGASGGVAWLVACLAGCTVGVTVAALAAMLLTLNALMQMIIGWARPDPPQPGPAHPDPAH
jgi:hypothetical protein